MRRKIDRKKKNTGREGGGIGEEREEEEPE